MLASTEVMGDAAVDASNRWQGAMEAEGLDYVVQTQFNSGKYDLAAAEAFKAVPIQRILVGRDIFPADVTVPR